MRVRKGGHQAQGLLLPLMMDMQHSSTCRGVVIRLWVLRQGKVLAHQKKLHQEKARHQAEVHHILALRSPHVVL